MAARLRTVFFGSSDFSVPSLHRLLAEQNIVAVCSQPDRPAGRGLAVTPTPVSVAARKAGIPVLTPSKLDDAFVARVRWYQPALLAVASYGKILPAKLLALEGSAALNLHPSLLPRYRGATPIQAALRDGADETGVTVFWMSLGLDDGDIALVRRVRIDPADSFKTLHDKLAAVGAELFAEAAKRLARNELPRTPQRPEDATYTKPLTKEDLRLRFDVPAQAAVNQVRSLSPKPAAWMPFDGKRLKILEAVALDGVTPVTHADSTTLVAGANSFVPVAGLQAGSAEGGSNVAAGLQAGSAEGGSNVAAGLQAGSAKPGDIIGFSPNGPVVVTLPGAICLTKVIPEGKPVMSGAEFAKRTAQTR
jgi:methionyl-tRNA formyltransferase